MNNPRLDLIFAYDAMAKNTKKLAISRILPIN